MRRGIKLECADSGGALDSILRGSTKIHEANSTLWFGVNSWIAPGLSRKSTNPKSGLYVSR